MYDMLGPSILARYRGQRRRLGELGSNAVDDGLGRYRESAVAQDGVELGLLHRGLERQQRFQLSVAVLLDDENGRMRFQEGFDVVVERECLAPKLIPADFLGPEDVERFANCAVATAEAHDADVVSARSYHDGFGQILRRIREFPFQPIEDDLVFGRILGISAILVVARAAREGGALGAHSLQSTIGYRIVLTIHSPIDLFPPPHPLPP